MDGKGRTIFYFLVICPKGTVFMKSIDAIAHTKDVALLGELIDEFVREVGIQHEVQGVINDVVSYVVINKLLIERHPILC